MASPSQASLLLQKQLKGSYFLRADLCKHPVDGFSAGLVDETNLFEWSVTIMGPQDTLYEGGFFNAIMTFPSNYPNSPPTVKFTSDIWHPNVYPDGKVCISILHPPGEDPNGYELARLVATLTWRSVWGVFAFVRADGHLDVEEHVGGFCVCQGWWPPLSSAIVEALVESIVLSIISMLSSPNDESPANVEAAVRVDDIIFFILFRTGL
ncbi:hypothetical protein RHMOL_Rhmol03G0145300 [Rhododendron molle]|uniref:Uncharacterized protein n=1 Tax=Rhododendron molle TaxID=49168 RepID=A0ACC0PFJ9_RHOML|nr:hypothetical protein RHMOL_Rhmol03G0145300 [Rhododendron molle]